MGTTGYNFAQNSNERLLPRSEYPELGFYSTERNNEGSGCSCFHSLRGKLAKWWSRVQDFSVKAWEMGRSDPRKVIFAAKVGLALMILAILIFLNEPFQDLGQYSVWAILTVVVVFEFSIGATFSKGFNRGLGTLSAGGLALATAELSQLFLEGEEVVVVISIFIVGFLATYAKLHPTMKAYEYGFRVFLLTYCFIMVSGYRTGEFIGTALTRFLLIATGALVALVVNICIYPIWAGEDLHNLVAKNFMDVAASLEGCVSEYLHCVEYKRVPSKILTYQASDDPVYKGYRSVIESKSQEDTLAGFAVWEPPHGPYKICKYPWEDYIKVSGAVRHCAFTVMALHGCILSEIQAPAERRNVFSGELHQVGTEGAKVLRDIGNKIKNMEKFGPGDILLEVNKAAEELQKKIDRRSYLLVNSEAWEIVKPAKVLESVEDVLKINEDENNLSHDRGETVLDLSSDLVSRSWDIRNKENSMPSGGSSEKMFKKQKSLPSGHNVHADAVLNRQESKIYESASSLSLATFTSLLIEFVARLEIVVNSFEELSRKAKFKEPMDQPAETEVVGFWTRLLRCFRAKN